MRTKTRTRLASTLLLVVLALALGCHPKRAADHPGDDSKDSMGQVKRPLVVGSQAPSLMRKSLDGAEIAIPSKAHDVTIIHFGATWSHVDKYLFPRLEEIRREFPSVQVVLVSIDDEEKWARGFKEWGVTYPIVWDKGHEITETYRPGTEPAVYVVDRDGVVRFILNGFRDGDELVLEDNVRPLTKPEEPGTLCQRPLRTNAMDVCLSQCARRDRERTTRCTKADCKSRCDPDSCRTRCETENEDRNRALTFCRNHQPKKTATIKTAASCREECHSEEMNNAFHACDYHSTASPKLKAECESICGLKTCYAKCS